MKQKLFVSALLKMRNFGVLLILLAVSLLIVDQSLLPAQAHMKFPVLVKDASFPVSIAIYIVMVVQTLLSSTFHEQFNEKQKIKHIQGMNYSCLRLFYEAKKHTNPLYLQKLKTVMDDKNDIVDSFFKGDKGFIKQRIVEKALNLVISYIKLLTNFCIRSRELSEVNLGSISDRINTNARKLSFVRDINTSAELRKAIDVDERLVENLKEEKKELERISVKLEYMESMINLLKHQVISSIDSEEILEKLDTAVNEADALDSVLHERRKNRFVI
ncbi:MAG: hypothetical protein Q8920_00880 [Bacillota bacterium]|nr:hypothetical protein [Bacillota bacterium]